MDLPFQCVVLYYYYCAKYLNLRDMNIKKVNIFFIHKFFVRAFHLNNIIIFDQLFMYETIANANPNVYALYNTFY